MHKFKNIFICPSHTVHAEIQQTTKIQPGSNLVQRIFGDLLCQTFLLVSEIRRNLLCLSLSSAIQIAAWWELFSKARGKEMFICTHLDAKVHLETLSPFRCCPSPFCYTLKRKKYIDSSPRSSREMETPYHTSTILNLGDS